MDDSDQVFRPTAIIPQKHILTLSWNIATEPKLYRELSPNPYSQKALQIISERFPDAHTADIVRAVVLAEPEGKYDRNFKRLEIAQQEEELLKQNEIVTEINKRLVQYYNRYASEFSHLPKEFIYASMSAVVFETADLNEIEEFYAQNQRRDFRLTIVDFIENVQEFTSTSAQLDNTNLSAPITTDENPMPRRPFLQIGLAAVSFILVFSFTTGIYAMRLEQKQTQETSQYQKAKKQILGVETKKERHDLPVRLKIPSINVDADIESVGVTSDGVMGVPDNTLAAGWFDLGPRPGEKGSAVIAGHLNGENGEAGVFTDLDKLRDGDKLYIEDSKGKSITFVVRESRIYNPGYADEVFNQSDNAYLNLITCDGAWNDTQKSYSKRLVVFADIAP